MSDQFKQNGRNNGGTKVDEDDQEEEERQYDCYNNEQCEDTSLKVVGRDYDIRV